MYKIKMFLKKLFKKKESVEKLRRFYLYPHDMEFENFLYDFLEEIKCQHCVVAWKLRGNKLYLYSDRPGLLIGKAGCNIDLLKQRSKEKLRSYQQVEDVYIDEIRGIVPKTKWTQKEIDESIRVYEFSSILDDDYE